MKQRLHLIVTILALSLSQSLDAFTIISNSGKPAYWPEGQVQYYFHTSVDSSMFAPLRAAFETWRSAGGISLSISELAQTSASPSSSDRKNYVVWTASGWRSLSFRPPSNALAVTLLSFNSSSGEITDADVYFNDEYFNWGSDGSHSLVDIQNIATHEFGHLLGLDHSSEDFGEEETELLDATMYYASGPGETERQTLNSSDTNGIRALYGTGSEAEPTITSVVELSRAGDSDVEYRVTGTNFSELTSFIVTRGNDESDRVARYRSIDSSTSATVRLDVDGFGSGGASMVAFNHPESVGSFDFDVETSGISATSTGGGGGCAIQNTESGSDFSWVGLYFTLFAGTSLLLARRRLYRPVQPQSEEEEY